MPPLPEDIEAVVDSKVATFEQQIAMLKQQRDALLRWRDEGRALWSGTVEAATIDEPDVLDASTASSGGSTPTKKATILDGAEELITEAGRPMPTREIVAGLRERGVTIGGQDEVDTVSVILTRSEGRFKSLGRKTGWTVRGAAEYIAAVAHSDDSASDDSASDASETAPTRERRAVRVPLLADGQNAESDSP